MAKAKSITPEERAQIERSVRMAWIRLMASCGPRQELLRKIKKKKALTPAELLSEDALFYVQYRKGTELTDVPVRDAITAAVERNDREFFKRLGRALTTKSKRQLQKRKPNELAMFLVNNWAKRDRHVGELFYLTPDALTTVCRERLKMHGLTSDAVTKTRRRLRLKPFKRQKRSVVLRGGRCVVPQLDKK